MTSFPNRPTACDTPNPPRKRVIPIRFASTGFHPSGGCISPISTIPNGAADGYPTGAPAILYAPVDYHNWTAERTEPMDFAKSSFPPVGPPLLTGPTDTTAIEVDEMTRPLPTRRRTEPIGFAVNTWRIDVPSVPLQVDTRVCSPIETPGSWHPVCASPVKPIEPCTMWMGPPGAGHNA